MAPPDEIQELKARIAALEAQLDREQAKVAAATTSLSFVGRALRWITVGEGLFGAAEAWKRRWRAQPTSFPVEETIDLGTAAFARVVRVGSVGLLIALLPTTILIWQNRLISEQNRYFQAQNEQVQAQNEQIREQILSEQQESQAARKAALIQTLYDCEPLKEDVESSANVDDAGEDSQVTRCQPRASARARAEAALAYVAIISTEKTREPNGGPTTPCNLRGALLSDAPLSDFGDLAGIDLRGADLRGADLSGADLTRTLLEGADLRRSNLEDATLEGSFLMETDLREAWLRGADLRRADLQRADLRDATLYEANLQGTKLDGAELYRANIRGADLRESTVEFANLRGVIHDRHTIWAPLEPSAQPDIFEPPTPGLTPGADLRQRDLSGLILDKADLVDADLRDADLRDAVLHGVNLMGADLRGANLEGALLMDILYNAQTRWPDGFEAPRGWRVAAGTNLHAARLSGAWLASVDLSEADLRGANLSDAVLTNAVLTNAILISADLRGADLRGADLRGTDLRRARLSSADLTDALLDDILTDERTIWPDGGRPASR